MLANSWTFMVVSAGLQATGGNVPPLRLNVAADRAGRCLIWDFFMQNH
jgi:hypothetical protein